MSELVPASSIGSLRALLDRQLESVPPKFRIMAVEFLDLFADRPVSADVDLQLLVQKVAVHFWRRNVCPDEAGRIYDRLDQVVQFQPTMADIVRVTNEVKRDSHYRALRQWLDECRPSGTITVTMSHPDGRPRPEPE